MYNKAIDKLRDEMAANTGFDALNALGDMMCDYLCAHRSAAAQILTEGKTLQGAMKNMEEYARKNRGKNNYACVPPSKAMELTLAYYGIAETAASTPASGFDVSLDDLLGV